VDKDFQVSVSDSRIVGGSFGVSSRLVEKLVGPKNRRNTEEIEILQIA
jgi:hypothetical protein